MMFLASPESKENVVGKGKVIYRVSSVGKELRKLRTVGMWQVGRRDAGGFRFCK